MAAESREEAAFAWSVPTATAGALVKLRHASRELELAAEHCAAPGLAEGWEAARELPRKLDRRAPEFMAALRRAVALCVAAGEPGDVAAAHLRSTLRGLSRPKAIE